jgi:hypothetical protein
VPSSRVCARARAPAAATFPRTRARETRYCVLPIAPHRRAAVVAQWGPLASSKSARATINAVIQLSVLCRPIEPKRTEKTITLDGKVESLPAVASESLTE